MLATAAERALCYMLVLSFIDKNRLGSRLLVCRFCTLPEQNMIWRFIVGLTPIRMHPLQRLNRTRNSDTVMPSPMEESSFATNSICSFQDHSS
jgi:hypothetical protein